ncbi:adhesion G protein-coupled receptor E3 [Chelonia mydas]|uniref:adhesion G protein-coupled receptor E3 n=1 Tax=Chelonia mydas TaxID=8469 RepID=UPI001CA8E562|nr:adhesion G protein-coupled receptor E3 [Chelonia mydas]
MQPYCWSAPRSARQTVSPPRGARLCIALCLWGTVAQNNGVQGTTEDCNNHMSCPPNAKCVNNTHCTCLDGYRPRKYRFFTNTTETCKDINECLWPRPPDCGRNAMCMNTAGTYYCTCIDGYKLSSGKTNFTDASENTCQGIDECQGPSPADCGPHANWTNVPGNYSCTCIDGYEPSSGKASFTHARENTCQDIDECQRNATVCEPHGNCINMPGSYRCKCSWGFGKSQRDSSKICTDIDECRKTPDICGPRATCINTKGSYWCECRAGYVPSNRNATLCQELQVPSMNSSAEFEGIKETCRNFSLQVKQSSGNSSCCNFFNSTLEILMSTCGDGSATLSLENTTRSFNSLLNSTSLWEVRDKQEVGSAVTVLLQSVELAALATALQSPERTTQNVTTESLAIQTRLVTGNCSRDSEVFTLSAHNDTMEVHCDTVTGAATQGTILGMATPRAQTTAQSSSRAMNPSLGSPVLPSLPMDPIRELHPAPQTARVYFPFPPTAGPVRLEQQDLCSLSALTGMAPVGAGAAWGEPWSCRWPRVCYRHVITETMFCGPVRMRMILLCFQAIKQEEEALCVYWKVVAESGSWSLDGCTAVHTNSTHTTCRCDHLSSFAILMAPTTVTESEPLTIVTYVRLALSLLCLFLAILTFLVCRSIHNVSTSLHLQLCLCLFLADLLFLTVVTRTGSRVACAVIAGFLHYLFLAGFTWMFLEGLHLFLTIRNLQVVNYTSASRFKKRFMYPFGYGVPALVVAISAAVNPGGYGTSKYCWLSQDRGFHWSFLGPVCAIILINIMFFALTLWILRNRLSSLNADVSTLRDHRLLTFKAIAQLFILGCTWSLGLLQVGPAGTVMAYLFTIVSSLQGPFIFLVHCLLNRQVREEYRRWIKGFRTSSTKSQTSDLSMSAVPTTSTKTE